MAHAGPEPSHCFCEFLDAIPHALTTHMLSLLTSQVPKSKVGLDTAFPTVCPVRLQTTLQFISEPSTSDQLHSAVPASSLSISSHLEKIVLL